MNYKENPYHNFRHAVDVLQSFYYMLTNSTVLKYLKEIEILALAVAALCHDLAHPGFNNFFQAIFFFSFLSNYLDNQNYIIEIKKYKKCKK